MKHIILVCAFLAVSGAASASWFTASGINKTEWRALSQEQRTMTKQEWAKKWGALSKEEKKMRLENVKSTRKDSSVELEKWDPVSKEGVKELKEKRIENQKQRQEKMQKKTQNRKQETKQNKKQEVKRKWQTMSGKAEGENPAKPKWGKGNRQGGASNTGGRSGGGRRGGR